MATQSNFLGMVDMLIRHQRLKQSEENPNINMPSNPELLREAGAYRQSPIMGIINSAFRKEDFFERNEKDFQLVNKETVSLENFKSEHAKALQEMRKDQVNDLHVKILNRVEFLAEEVNNNYKGEINYRRTVEQMKAAARFLTGQWESVETDLTDAEDTSEKEDMERASLPKKVKKPWLKLKYCQYCDPKKAESDLKRYINADSDFSKNTEDEINEMKLIYPIDVQNMILDEMKDQFGTRLFVCPPEEIGNLGVKVAHTEIQLPQPNRQKPDTGPQYDIFGKALSSNPELIIVKPNSSEPFRNIGFHIYSTPYDLYHEKPLQTGVAEGIDWNVIEEIFYIIAFKHLHLNDWLRLAKIWNFTQEQVDAIRMQQIGMSSSRS